jgi:hypothetical protein
MHPHNPEELLAFYEERVLPVLYQRLDRAFPELQWAWTGDGWKGVKRTDAGAYARSDETAIVCNHPWGYVTRSGKATSWLAYIHGGAMPQGPALASAIRRLADLAGVEYRWAPALGSYEAVASRRENVDPFVYQPEFLYVPVERNGPATINTAPFAPQYPAEPVTPVTPATPVHPSVATPVEQNFQPARHPSYYERQAQLWESFAAYCHECLCLCREAAKAMQPVEASAAIEESYWHACVKVREQLEQQCGLDVPRADHLPLGVYPSAVAVLEHLTACGFTQEEINAAAVLGDTRLPGRVIIPWRDALGRIATIIAEDLSAEERSTTRRLYIKGGQRPAIFGLDVALRPASGGVDELILVDTPLDVVYFQQHGLPNVAMMAGASKTPTKQDWEVLADLGVCNATLALADDTAAAARTCKSLLDAAQAAGAPSVFALPYGALATSHGAGDFARTQGMAKLMHGMSRRQHAYQYLAAAIIRRHRPGKQANRNALGQILREAIAFDAAVYHPEREAALDEHFWGEICAATRVGFRSLRSRLRHRPMIEPVAAPQAWQQETTSAANPPHVDWVNSLLHAAAAEHAEHWQTVWTNDPPPAHYAPPPKQGTYVPRSPRAA